MDHRRYLLHRIQHHPGIILHLIPLPGLHHRRNYGIHQMEEVSKEEGGMISDFGFRIFLKAEGGGRNEISELINYHVLF